ncbi:MULTISPECIES: ParA family protein [unclassified Nocardia]|uniref:ParA family protein n=1 Tax=unclassified Nocardia TaxID=2637762 RepID=UPI00278C1C30|nr:MULTISPECIES: ParA family protein [unclassified Nocardia]
MTTTLELPKPYVITLGNLKGGVGKTTTAFFLACYFAQKHDKKVLVVCADPLSQTGYSWYTLLTEAGVAVPFDLIHFPSRFMASCIKDNAAKGYEVIIVDAGGESAEILKGAIPESDDVILIAGATGADMKRIPPTFVAAEEATRNVTRDIGVYVLMTKCPVTMKGGRNVSSEYLKYRRRAEETGYDVFDTYISNWKWYREAADGDIGDGAENPIEDLGEYEKVGEELVARFRTDADAEMVSA